MTLSQKESDYDRIFKAFQKAGVECDAGVILAHKDKPGGLDISIYASKKWGCPVETVLVFSPNGRFLKMRQYTFASEDALKRLRGKTLKRKGF